MTPNNSARDADRPNRLPVLIGSVVALLCLGAGVASAQTAPPPETETDEAPTASDTDDPAAEAAGDTQNSSGEGTDTDGGEPADRSARARAPRLLVENVRPHKIYFAGKQPAEFRYEHRGAGRADLRVEAVRHGKGKRKPKVIQAWREDNVPADKKQLIRWDGSRSRGGHVRKGKFFFRVETVDGLNLRRKRADGRRSLLIKPAIFPIRARHQYWDGFGAGRGHQGQDLGARCGAKLVAAEPGKVVARSYDGGGYGYYLIINVRGQRRAEVYGHLKRAAKVRKGKRVKTGEKIGLVGATGNASGCHLHFEYWKGDYPGGHATPRVTKRLRAWDKYS